MALVDIFTFNFNNAVQQTRAIPETAVPVGITGLSAAIARGSLDPAIVLTWSLEVSRDGGATWLPWGAAGTTGGNFFDMHGVLTTESYFTVSLDTPADAQTRLRGSLTNTGARMTTTITIRGDTTPLVLRTLIDEHHSVLYDNSVEAHGGSISTITTASFTVTSAIERAAMLSLITGNDSFTVTAISCGGASGTVISGTSHNESYARLFLYGAIAPASGTQTASVTLSASSGAISLGAMTVSGAHQTTAFNNGTLNAQTGVTTAGLTVTTTPGDLTFACLISGGALTAPTQTQIWYDTSVTGSAGSYGASAGTSNVHNWTQPSGVAGSSGANIIQSGTVLAGPAIEHDYTLFPKFLLQPAVPWQENMA